MYGKTKTTLMLLALAGVFLVTQAAPPLGAADEPVRLHLIWTNDIHGHIAPEEARFMNPNFPPPLGGGASLANYVAQVRAEAERNGESILMVDVGDFFQGTPVGTKTKGDAVVEYFNTLDYDVVVPGNHDFDMGRDNCKRLADRCEMPWLAANLRDESDGEIVDFCQPTIMIERAGVKIGCIGIITPGTEAMSFPQNIAGLIFDPMVPAIEKYRDELLAQGADLIALLIHEGLPYDPEGGWKRIAEGEDADSDQQDAQGGGFGYVYGGAMNLMEIANAVEGIDIAVGGHTHRGYNEPWIDPMTHTMCFESYGNGSSVGHAILQVDVATGTLVGYDTPHDRGTLITLFEDELWPEKTMQQALKPYVDEAEAAMNRVIGSASVNLTRGGPSANLVGNLVTDAMRLYFEADFSFQNLGGLRADVPSGDITAKDVFSILPFGNELVIVQMDGRMIRRIVERKVRGESGGLCISGARVTYNRNRPNWDRVCELEVGGEPLDPDRIYNVVCTSFLMEGNSGLDFLTTIPAENINLTQITTAESVEHYFSLNSPVRPRVDDRWVENTKAEQASYLESLGDLP
jgi:5'-nucleotidase / UDP-sugar diphosphatase